MSVEEIIQKALDAPKTGYTASDLQAIEFPPIKFIVDGYIPEGETILASRPKLGKSWMCLDIAIAVSTGDQTLGGISCEQGAVLYLALEDNPRRLKSRMAKLMPGESWPASLRFETSWPRLNEGGAERIRQWVESEEKPRLVIVDTLGKIRASKSENDTSAYQADYDAMAALQMLASEKGLAILVVHHDRKMGADDPIDTVSGTLGLVGAADTILVLQRRSEGTVLYGRGRDIEEIESAITFDKARCRWKVMGDAEQLRKSHERKEVLAAMKVAKVPLQPNELAKLLEKKPASVRKILTRMAEDGEIQRLEYGKYACNDYVADPCHTGHSVTVEAETVTASAASVTASKQKQKANQPARSMKKHKKQ